MKIVKTRKDGITQTYNVKPETLIKKQVRQRLLQERLEALKAAGIKEVYVPSNEPKKIREKYYALIDEVQKIKQRIPLLAQNQTPENVKIINKLNIRLQQLVKESIKLLNDAKALDARIKEQEKERNNNRFTGANTTSPYLYKKRID